jgi:hypothetical protein
MRTTLQGLGLSVLALLSPVLAHAATIHVNPQGGGGGGCTQPQRTIAAGIACLKGGDTLVLHAGTYTNDPLHRLPSGTSSARTTVRTAGDGAVLLRSTTRDIDCVWCVSGNYQTVDGGGNLTLDGGGQSIFVVGGTQRNDITIRGTRVTNGRGQGFFVDQGNRWLIDGVEIDHNGPPGDNFKHGMYFSPWDSVMQNSSLHDNACYNLQNYSSSGHPPRNNTFRGNTFTRSGCGVTSQGSGHQWLGNTFYGPPTHAGSGGTDGGLLIDGPNQSIIGNTFYCSGIITIGGGDQGGVVRDNVFSCPDRDLRLHTENASLSNNTFNRNTLPPPTGGAVASSSDPLPTGEASAPPPPPVVPVARPRPT